MDFRLNEEQRELQRVVRDVVERECPPSLVRAVVMGEDDGSGFWKTLLGLELPGLALPVEVGGTGATAIELVLTVEELGRGGDPTPFLVTATQYGPVLEACDAGELLQAVCSGTTGAVAWEGGAAEQAGDEWVLRGTARTVLDGDRADELAVVTPDGVFVVPASAARATRTPSFDASLHVADVELDGVAVPADRAFPGVDVTGARHVAVTGIAAATVGASQRILELVLDHVRDRKQFGVPIGSFQAVKHMAVDVYVAIERARALCHFAALTIAEDDPRRSLAASMAKAAAGDAQRLAVQHGIQLYGGLGYTWENDVQLFARRAKAGELLLGGTREHRALVAQEVMAR